MARTVRVRRALPPEPEHQLSSSAPVAPSVPEHWSLGALLNVRPTAMGYVVTQFPEENDSHHPERSMRFNTSWECQDFVSRWYARIYVDEKAK